MIGRAKERRAGPLQAITLLLPSSLATMAIVVLIPILPQLLEHFRSTPNWEYLVPMVLTIPSVCLVVASPMAGLLADIVGRRRILIVSMAIYAGLGILPLFLDNIWEILASRIGVGIVEAVILTVSTALIGDFFKGEDGDASDLHRRSAGDARLARAVRDVRDRADPDGRDSPLHLGAQSREAGNPRRPGSVLGRISMAQDGRNL
jgi:MFS family permease